MKVICDCSSFCENKDCPHIKKHKPIDVYLGKLCSDNYSECAYQNYQEIKCESDKEIMDEKNYRCNDPKRHLKSVLVCLHKGCVHYGCGFYFDSVLRSGDNLGGNPGVSKVDRSDESKGGINRVSKPHRRGIKSKASASRHKTLEAG